MFTRFVRSIRDYRKGLAQGAAFGDRRVAGVLIAFFGR